MIPEIPDGSLITLGGLALAFAGFIGLGRVFRYTGVLKWLADRYGRLNASNIVKWLSVGLLLAYVVFVEGRGLGSITLNPLPAWQLVIYAVMGFVAMIFGMGIVTLILRQLGLIEPRADVLQVSRLNEVILNDDDNDGPINIGDQPWSVLLFTAFTAGATEEILTTGYPVLRILEATGFAPVAVVVPAVAFGLLHLNYGRGYAIVTMVPGVVFGSVFLLSGSLTLVIAMHTLWDVMAFGVRKYRSEAVEQQLRRVGPTTEG